MKKLIFALLLALLIATPVLGYTVQPGDTPYGIWGSDWKTELAKYGITDPRRLPVGLVTDDTLGIALPTVVALFEDSLASRLSSTATSTFTLVRGTDKQLRSLSGRYGFIIDEGTASEEFFVATCSGTTCTIVTRGLDVADGQTAVAGNQYEHRRGATVKATDFPQLSLITRMLNGQDSFENYPYYATPTTLPTTSGQFATKYYVDSVGAGGFTSANVSTTRGLSVDGSSPEKVGVNVSSTTGMAFDSSGKLYQTIGNALEYRSSAIGVVTSTIVSQIATATPTASLIPIASASGRLDSWLNDSTITSSTITSLNVSSTSFVQWVYLSASTTVTTTSYSFTIPTGSKAAIVYATAAGANADCTAPFKTELLAFSIGKTTANFQQVCGSAQYIAVLVTWNATLDVSFSSTAGTLSGGSLTAYFFK